MKISDRLRELRMSLGLSQPQAATKFHIPLPSWKNYEKGPSEPGSGALRGLAEGGVNINWLLTGKGEMLQDAVIHESIDAKRLQLAIETIEEVLAETGRTIPVAKKAEAIKLAYEIYIEEDEEKDSEAFAHTQKILSRIIKSMS